MCRAIHPHQGFLMKLMISSTNSSKARGDEPVFPVQACEETLGCELCTTKVQCYRGFYRGRVSCKRLQVQASYPGADLLLQNESKVRYYPACISEDCLLPCAFFHHHTGRIQYRVFDGEMPRCDCIASADTLVTLRPMAA